jgi:hypothetical protein
MGLKKASGQRDEVQVVEKEEVGSSVDCISINTIQSLLKA